MCLFKNVETKNIGEFYVYGSVHRNIFYEITNRCSYILYLLLLYHQSYYRL